jgi:RNA-dependent RNA polymerase
MEQLKISWGVQYELARGVLADKWTWDNISDNVLIQLRGSNAEAASRVSAVVSGTIGRTSTVPTTESSTTNLNLW